MVNIHQVCRLCMSEIAFGGIDCMILKELRAAIQKLYGLEITAKDECSKRVCKLCFDKVADHLMHHKTVSQTQEKIKEYIDLQRQAQMRTSFDGVNIKSEDNHAEDEDVVICIPEDEQLNEPSSKRKNTNNLATAPSTPLSPVQKKFKGTTKVVPMTNGRTIPSDTSKSANTVPSKDIDEHLKTGIDTLKQSPVATTSAQSAKSVKSIAQSAGSGSSERSKLIQKRRSSLYPRESPDEKRPKLSETGQQQQLMVKSKANGVIAKSKNENDRKQYFGPAFCFTCNCKLSSGLESKYHIQYHKTKRCVVCCTAIADDNLKKHFEECLMNSDKLTTAEMLAHMTLCTIPLVRKTTKNSMKSKKNDSNHKPENGQRKSVDKPNGKIQRKQSTISTGSEGSGQDASEASTTISTASNSVQKTDVLSQINKKIENKTKSNTKSATTSKKSSELMQALRVNNSIPISWDQEAIKERLFTVHDWPETRNKYIELNAEADKLSETENLRITNLCKAIEHVRQNKNVSPIILPTLLPSPALCSDRPRSKITEFFASTKNPKSETDTVNAPEITGSHNQSINQSVQNRNLNSSASLTPTGPPARIVDLNATCPLPVVASSINNRRYSIAYSDYNEQSGLRLNITSANQNPMENLPNRSTVTPDVSIRSILLKNGTSQYQCRIAPNPSPANAQPSHDIATVTSVQTSAVAEPITVTSSITALKILSPNEVNMKAQRTANINGMIQNSNNNNGINNGSLNRSSPSVQYNRNNESNDINNRIPSQYQNSVPTLNYNPHLQQQQQQQHHQPFHINFDGPPHLHHHNHHPFPIQQSNPHSISTSVPSQGIIVRPIPLTPRPTPSPDSSSANDSPIQVSLIREKSDFIELIFKKNARRIMYTDMTNEQRIEVQNSLMTCDVWLTMLDYIKKGQPSKATLALFKKLLPPVAMLHFFKTLENQLNG